MSAISFFVVVLIDFLFGDPYWLPHPVRWIGKLINFIEKKIYPVNGNKNSKFLSGIFMCIIVISTVCTAGFLFLFLCRLISPVVYNIGEIITGFYCLSARSLVSETEIVGKHLLKGDMVSARYAVSRIVGRDSEKMDSNEIARATVETIAENIVDGIISPLFYLLAGGPLAALAFKAVSTMDSMIGYKNERYRDFGKCAARLDDFLNFIPARITAFLIIPSGALITGKNAIESLHCVYRDRLKHPSPNSAHGEAAVAGALGLKLGGKAVYNGKSVYKPVINKKGREPERKDIYKTINLVYGSVLVSVVAIYLIILYVN
ncbi:MAG: cobalamin biosynthesis protein CobD [Fibrobacter sp.]|nr:cobalamin biosynthesis protein CobD [Fibrobacter sp.]